MLTPSKDFGGTSVKRLTDFYKRFGFVENKGKNKDFTIRDTMYRVPEVSAQTEAISAVSPTVAPAPETTIAVSPEQEVKPVTQPIFITDILKDIKVSFAPENAIEVVKGTREDIAGRKLTYNAAITAQATDKNGTPIGLITKRSNEDGTLSFTLKNTSGQNINKGKSYPTERDARTVLAEQVNKKLQIESVRQKLNKLQLKLSKLLIRKILVLRH